MLDFGRKPLVSHDYLQKRLTLRKGEDVRYAEAREKLEFELGDVILKLEMMKDWTKMFTDDGPKAAAPLLQVVEAKSVLSKVAQKWNEFE